MSDSLFLRLVGIEGEEPIGSSKGLIRIFSYSHGLNMQVTASRPSQGENSPLRRSFCQHASFSVTKGLDKASPKIFEASSLGTCFEHAIVYLCSPKKDPKTKNTEAEPVLSIVLKDAVIASFKYGFQGDWQVEHLGFVYGSIGWTLDWINPEDGESTGTLEMGWEGMKNVAEGISIPPALQWK